EIALRGGLDAVGTGTEINAVEIEFEDLVLTVLVFEPERQHRLLQLARESAVRREEQVFRELLRDGRAALLHATAKHIRDHGAADADRINAMVRIESAVLDGDESLRHIARQFLERGRWPPLAAHRKGPAVHADDLDRRWAFGDFKRMNRRQA